MERTRGDAAPRLATARQQWQLAKAPRWPRRGGRCSRLAHNKCGCLSVVKVFSGRSKLPLCGRPDTPHQGCMGGGRGAGAQCMWHGEVWCGQGAARERCTSPCFAQPPLAQAAAAAVVQLSRLQRATGSVAYCAPVTSSFVRCFSANAIAALVVSTTLPSLSLQGSQGWQIGRPGCEHRERMGLQPTATLPSLSLQGVGRAEWEARV